MRRFLELALVGFGVLISAPGMAQSEVSDIDLECHWTVEESTKESEIGEPRDFLLSVRSSGAYLDEKLYPFGEGQTERGSWGSLTYRTEVSPRSLDVVKVIRASETGALRYRISRETLSLKVSRSVFPMNDNYEGSGTCKKVATPAPLF